ncbi:hypothetical protein O181_029489 [Austropuccinia psidii MF-1]|uniref:Reverse transcriptase domain-containing protein n=1 Tax=Austropuccinia psidii MF-1 TaxID=1389203 RepID=A0A9Q3H4L5_9BASI|nr:hypothetical protein [Austropuccinia psidii MF-1]
MSFGIKNASAHFQRMVDTIFQEESLEGWMEVYIDDIIIYSETWEDNVQYIDGVLSKCTPINLKISLKKCNFGQQELLALGHKVSGLSLAIDQNIRVEVLLKEAPKNIKEMQSFLGKKGCIWEHQKKLTNAPVLILPDLELPFKLYIDAACSQGLGVALHQRQIIDGEPREGVICYISRQLKDSKTRYGGTQTECLWLVWAVEKIHYYLKGVVFDFYTEFTALKSLLNMKTTNSHILRWQIAIQEYRVNMAIKYKEAKSHTNADGLGRWPLDNVKSNPDYYPEVEGKIAIHFMEMDRRNKFRFSEWAPGNGTPVSGDIGSEGTETPILGIGSSELYNEFFNAVMYTYAKHKKCGILLQLLEQKYRSLKLESKHTSALTVMDRDHISLILQECHDCPYMGQISEDRTKQWVASTAWWPKWEQGLSEYINTYKIFQKANRKHGNKTDRGIFWEHPVFQVSLVKPYFQTEKDRFPSRKKNPTPPGIVEVEGSPVPVKKIIKARKIRLNGKYQRQYLVSFKNQTADKDKWLAENAIPDGNLHLRIFRASRRSEGSHQL